jgi:hypothetical protein
MSTLYLAEFDRLPVDAGGRPVMAPAMPPIVEQTVAIGVSHAESAAFSGKTLFLQVHCDVICSIASGPAPVATASNQRLAANETR